jgi:hypothetical protein
MRDLPPEDELSDKQIRYIRDLSLSDNRNRMRVQDQLEFYSSYPTYFFISLYDIDKYFDYYGRDQIFEKAFKSYISNSSNFHIPNHMDEEGVKAVLDTNKVSSVDAADFLMYRKRDNDDRHVHLVAEKFPEEYERIYGEGSSHLLSDIKNFIEHPSKDNKGKFKSSMQALSLDDPNDLSQIKKIKSHFINNSNNYLFPKVDKSGHRSSMDGSSLKEHISGVKEAISKKESYHDPYSPFSMNFVNDELLGEVITLNYLSYMIDTSALDILDKNTVSDGYYEINLPDSYEKEAFGVRFEDSKAYLIDEDRSRVTFLSDIPDMSSGYDFSMMKEFVHGIPLRQEDTSILMLDYVKQLFSSKRPDAAFNELMKNPFFESFMESTCDDLFGAKVHNYQVLPEDSKDRTFSSVLPFRMDAATEIWNIIPVKFRHLPAKGGYGIFYSTSGLFPCNEIYEKAKEDLKYTMNFIDHIKGTCPESENEKLRKNLVYEYENKKTICRSSFDKDIKEFLLSPSVQKKSLSDFPKLLETSIDFLSRNLTDEEVYDYNSEGMVSSVNKAISTVSNIPIYLIDEAAMKNKFGKDVLSFLKFSPDECGGFYSNYFAGEKAIVVYTGKSGGEINQVLGEIIGLNNYTEGDELNIETESTLWHEMAHALSQEAVSGKTEKADTMAEWMNSSDEILAISYGNLQHIKNKLREYFTIQFPFNKKIESGLINEMKSGIVSTFPMEFNGLDKEMAIKMVSDSVPDFDDEVLEMLNNMSKKEKVDYLVRIFTYFFMGKFMRGKVEEHLFGDKKDSKVTFKEEKVVPEKDTPWVRGQKDEHIIELESRDDYQQFLKSSIDIVSSQTLPEHIVKRFTHRVDPRSLNIPTQLYEVLMMVFDLKGAVNSTDIDREGVFYRYAPSSLIQYLKEVVIEEKEIAERTVIKAPEPQIPSPEEAEETGKFMAEQDEAYGPDWMWLANNKDRLQKSSSFADMSPSYVDESRYGKDSFFLEDVKDDMFIHFTSPKRAKEIINSGHLMVDSPYQGFGAVGAFAVSTKYGVSVPGTQTTHISKIPSDLVGVLFTTDMLPERGTVEEVIWDNDVQLKDSTIISHDEALSILNPRKEEYSIDRNFVIYDEESNFFNWLSDKTEKKESFNLKKHILMKKSKRKGRII